jgi:hypothetical protein
LAAFLLSTAPAHADDAERELLAAAGEGFEIRRSEHFMLAYDTPERQAKNTIARLEATYSDARRFCDHLGLPCEESATRLEVIQFAEPETFRAYAERLAYDHRGSFGFYHARTNRSAFFDASADPALSPAFANLTEMRAEIDALVSALDAAGSRVRVELPGQAARELTRDEAVARLRELRDAAKQLEGDLRLYHRQSNEMVIQHEGAHHVMFALGVHRRDAANPAWLMEGLACLFEPPPVSGTPGLSGMNQFRLFDLRRLMELSPDERSISRERLATLQNAGRFISFESLVTDPSVFEHHEGVWPAYAEAWALAQHLYKSRPDDLAAYIRRVNDRRADSPPDAAQALADFTAAFGAPDADLRDAALSDALALPAPQAAAELK